jgi:glycosyltransferase involved in cell wall biosynthesis
MRQTDAKYKVYLHQDVFIVNRTFIRDLVSLFEKNPQLGLIGMVGAEKIAASGIWWEAPYNWKWGMVYESSPGRMRKQEYGPFQDDYVSVQAVDGLLMATQYDLPWREDLFDGWHFYDISQCVEFLLAGYDVGVPNQSSPWCIHDCGISNLNRYDDYRKKFLAAYGKQLFPLVSVLIPTFNRPHYLIAALQSVLVQTYPNIEIVVSDDSTNSDTWNALRPYLETCSNIRYVRNQKEKWVGNFINCLELAAGEFVNFLNDDDLFHPEKIQKMMQYMLFDSDIVLATSSRVQIDKDGNVVDNSNLSNLNYSEDKTFRGYDLGNFILANCLNIIGEPTTALFRKECLTDPIGTYSGQKIHTLGDVAMWLSILPKGKAVYLSQPLSYFRKHDDQVSKDFEIGVIPSIHEWFHLIELSRLNGFLHNERLYQRALANYLKHAFSIVEYAYEHNKEELLIQTNALQTCESALKNLTVEMIAQGNLK